MGFGRVFKAVATGGLSEIDRHHRHRRQRRERERAEAEQRRQQQILAEQQRREAEMRKQREEEAQRKREEERRLEEERQREEARRRERQRQREEQARRERERREAEERERRRVQQEKIAKEKREYERKLAESERRVNELSGTRDRLQGQIRSKRAELDRERRQIQHFRLERSDRNVIRLILLGETGDGKSTMANRLSGDRSEDADQGRFRVSPGIHSCSQQIQKETSEYVCVNGQRYVLSVVDTPGSGDSFGRDRLHAAELVEFLRGCDGVHQFLLVKQNSNPRLNNFHVEILMNMVERFGVGFWGYFSIILTHTDTDRDRRRLHTLIPNLQKHIREVFNLTEAQAPLRVFAVGLDDYETALDELVSYSARGWYACGGQLRSPHDDLEADVQRLETELNRTQNEINAKREDQRQWRNMLASL